ncbi:alpha/beta hydrolase [Aquibium carbonis]|uniref:Alpha/beta hydrolase n=1 Tax=Aquibium carbonis TaxID=2495581 RepID=A0A3R9Y556_9HYPH|nr:alpha/beta hydrolase [Aquibium carbonis]RST84469.1 alpha/beta hydrolase [Aquibium carbonis]
MPMDDGATLHSATGAALRLYNREPETRPRAVVQINHGLAEHAARYGRFADHLARHGIASVAHDHRGHGHTRAPDAPAGLFATGGDGVAKVIADVLSVHDHIAQRWPGVPVIIFGHSMGGLIALNTLFSASHRVAGAAIWNANFSAGLLGRVGQGLLAWERFRLGSDVPSRIVPKLTFQAWAKQVPNARTAFDWLSRDPAKVDAYVADPLCGFDASVSMWQNVFAMIFAGADDTNLARIRRDLPINIVGGEKDPATDGGKATEQLAGRLRAMEFSGVQSKVYAETRHESLNEVNRDEVMADFVAWVDGIDEFQSPT